ncbi:isovaleryl-CoA dehydrogenase protein [Salinisphaera shabanensis E1L3A]|uniref:Isovaleryl-CoA dehydrogenase protein n=1 Tax=Salinisphaera shabanensis E1L3A TaxID=1033802 RepID=F7QA61_9GAMM|nr:acyl-CoA dehydrogenase family protein [Salinisphaera shabanensis]ERJ20385.1 isovaleryl-CoA dehydrogenase protein [Salinisphaera shabanensis E1L3A]
MSTPASDRDQANPQSNIPDAHGLSLFERDPGLARLLRVYLGDDRYRELEPQLVDLGERAAGELDDWAMTADKNPPTLVHRNRRGEDSQRIEKHPSYIALERVAYGELGLAALSHTDTKRPSLIKYALTYLFVQAEFGLCCPVSMTDSLTRTLRKFGDAGLIDKFLPYLTSRDMDTLYQGAMFMTEQAAGSDIARITTRATRGDDGEWRLRGDKWFCSNADADLAMVLARADDGPEGMAGIGLFLLPKTRDDGSRNSYRIVRLKDKLGTRSMASGEIVLEGATAYLIGDIGRGFQQIADMMNMSRLSNGVRAAGLMRRALSEALHVARHREAFGRRLIDMPLMQRQLLKIMLPAEQARSMFMHISRRLDAADAGDETAAKHVRLLTPLIKFRATRDSRKAIGDAMEVRGGVGYIEEWPEAKLLRDAHLGSIWEGTSNIVALDVMRAVRRQKTLAPLMDYLHSLVADIAMPECATAVFAPLIDRVSGLVEETAEQKDDDIVRQVASALYNLCSAVFLAWEAAQQPDDARRLALALLVVRYKLQPADPLTPEPAGDETELQRALLDETPLSVDQALTLCP